ncbi:DNA-processing protein DprA [Microbulbifer aggregans]|uniref:DNA-processing protein DprA n=1 Tax=Microbulbifer aggregans TaxID=1769779 RepID=UPI001CFDB62B|nr:DNA-processing protein DprA [Microbulbifer aggregans]
MDALTATLALLRLEGIGPALYWQLLEHFGSAAAALEQPPEHFSRKLPDRALAQLAEYQRIGLEGELGQWAQAERDRCHNRAVTLLEWGGSGYPPLLQEIHRPPPVLYVRGDVDTLAIPQIAVVGARRASQGGLDNARAFSSDLAAAGFAITSGLALGVDGAAHSGALKAGGKTVAVLGTGVDRLYPRRNVKLAEEILDSGGTIVSELPLGTAPEAGNFPRRNRIISGLSLGVLLVEAAVRSGSLITARLALEQNREVFAIPGSIHNPLARGCHHMIKQGAALVEASTDIVTHLGGALAGVAQQVELFVGSTQASTMLPRELQRIVQSIAGDIRTIEQIAGDTGDEAGALMSALLQLELQGLVEPLAGGYQLTAQGAKHLAGESENR